MLTLIIGLLITAGGVYGTFITCNWAFLLLYVLGLGTIVVPLFQPLVGWDEGECFKQYLLMPLLPGSEYYVAEDKEGNLMYRYKNENNEEVIRHSTVVDTNYGTGGIKDKPVLKELVLKPKKNLWCLPIFCSKKTQYVIKLPQDKIEIAILNK